MVDMDDKYGLPRPGGRAAPPGRESRWTFSRVLFGGAGLIVAGIALIACVPERVYDPGRSTLPAATSWPTPTPTPTPAPAPTRSAAPRVWPDGQYLVGVDIPAGRMRTRARVDDPYCYWSMARRDDSTEIVANDIVEGGIARVTLRKGLIFTSRGCAQWVRDRD